MTIRYPIKNRLRLSQAGRFFSFREKEEMSLTEKTDIRDSDEKVVEIEMERLRNFTNHTIAVEIG